MKNIEKHVHTQLAAAAFLALQLSELKSSVSCSIFANWNLSVEHTQTYLDTSVARTEQD